MKFYLVTQTPKRSGLATAVVFVAAKSSTDAIRIATEQHPDHIIEGGTRDISKPQAREVLQIPGDEYTLAPLTAFHF